ncbi:hypothetical protein ACHAWF_008901 [Thalassiosira exigua]
MALLLCSFLLQNLGLVRSQPRTCTGRAPRFPPPSRGRCTTTWGRRGETKAYPGDFEGIVNRVEVHRCPSRGKRVVISNGVPNHDVVLFNREGLCEYNWVVEMPLDPKVADERTEVPIRGMIAMATNGVPAYGPQEADSNNAVEVAMAVSGAQGAQYWYGHAGPNSAWHVHNPKMGKDEESSDTLLGYALDGFPIYGHLEDEASKELDACNGLYKDGKYQYHVRTLEQVDGNLYYCNGASPETNWNYVLGCYSGSVEDTRILDSSSYSLDADCVVDIRESALQSIERKRPNVIIMQPDDMPFYDIWKSKPPNNPSTPDKSNPIPNRGIPHVESLRLNGMQMLQAYTASPMCGTSRFATMTSRYASRAVSNDEGNSIVASNIRIPSTKLEGDDCTKNNLAVQFRDNGYRTAMIGKWHLSYTDDSTYTYQTAVDTVKECGFNTVEGLYVENLAAGNGITAFSDGSFSHNMEWLTGEAIKFIKDSEDERLNQNCRIELQPFFMYFNPTVFHSADSIASALRDFSCRDTAAGRLDSDPFIPGMTDGMDCASYRQTIFDRADSDDDLGAIWIDDSVGALLQTMRDMGILDNTIFVFQADHGIDPKNTLYEGGVRIPQIIHYPDLITAGTLVGVPVSVLDLGPSLLDYAGIMPSYEMDGLSWKDAIGQVITTDWDDRCLFFENERDRAVRCGCYKYLGIFQQDGSVSTTFLRGNRKGLSADLENVFDLCDETKQYVTQGSNREATNLIETEPSVAADMKALIDCHLQRIEAADFSQCQLSSSASDIVAASESRWPSNISLLLLSAVMYHFHDF